MRPRKDKAAQKLPPRVYAHGKKYRWHPKAGGSIAVCPVDSPLSVVWREYEKLVTRSEQQSTVAGLINEYFDSPQFLELAPSTQYGNRQKAKPLVKVFGKMAPDSVQPKQVRMYMDARGKKAKASANKELAILSKVMKWAYERGKVSKNPCQGIKPFPPGVRKRYITDEEYQAVYQCACDAVKVAMELSYLCAARKGDILKLRRDKLLEEGIFIKQGKTGKEQIKMWSPRLRAAIAISKQLSVTPSLFVLCSANGKQLQDHTLHNYWTAAKNEAAARFGIKTDFTFHDLKAKGISDYEGTMADKQRFSGHKKMGQINTYDRKTDLVPTIGSDRNSKKY